jgi:hypothetical protein
MFLLILLQSALSQQPAYPQWNPVWYLPFDESSESWWMGNHEVSGMWYYNATGNMSRMDRSSGRWDMFCGANEWFMFFDTPCTHLVTGGVRYLVYPDLGVCCNCCTDQDGCGILKPNWLNNSMFIGTVQFNDSISAYMWNQQGNSPNFYWETTDANPLNRQILQLNNGEFEQYLPSANRSTAFDMSVFALPAYCNSQVLCDGNTVCAELQGSGGNSEYLKYLKG